MPAGLIWIDSGQIAEGSSGTRAMVFTVRRTGGTDAFAVGYNTADFSARAADADYVPVAGVLQFGVGVESMTVEVPVNGDGKLENAERLFLQLSSPTNGAAFGRHPGDGGPPIGLSYGVIRNDDHLPVPGEVWVNDTSVVEGTGGTRELVFTVMRTGTVAFDVDFATSPWGDFGTKAGTLHFAEGVMSQTVSVTVSSDAIVEPNQRVELTLRNATNGMKLDFSHEWTDGPQSSGSGVILDDDANPNPSYVSINDIVFVEGNSGTKQAALTVTRSGGSGAFTVDFETAGDDVVRSQGTLSFAAGENAKTILVTVNGDKKYEPYDGFSVRLSNAIGAEIIKNVGYGQITNDDRPTGPGIVFLGDATMVEGAGGTRALTFTVSRSQGTGAFTVDYATKAYTGAGTATAGSDFVAKSGILSFAEGETRKTISVTINGDGAVEQDEVFGLVLSNATNGALFYNPAYDGSYGARGTILNDDGWSKAGAVWIEDASVVEGDSGVTQMTFTVRRGGGSSAFSVNYTSADSNAGASDGDYSAVAGKLNFGVGVESQTITVAVNGDVAAERGDEYIAMLLFDATNGATIVDGYGAGLIRDDDITTTAAEGSLSISNGSVVEGNAGSRSMAFTVTRSGTGAFSVNYKTADGTAIAGSDYAAASGTLNFAAGETNKTISVAITGDVEYEKDQSFFVFLFGAPETVTVANGLATGVIVNDDPQTLAPDSGYVSRNPVIIPAGYLLANDPPGMTMASVSNAINGSTALVEGGVQFDATGNAASTVASFAYTASDGTIASHPAQVSLKLIGTNAGSNRLTVATSAGEFSVVDGLEGNDQLTGGAGRDRFLGSAGNDRLFGEEGNDTLFGGVGADELAGGTGFDALYGGAGDDIYHIDDLDSAFEFSPGGIDYGGNDTVLSSINYVLGSFIENLTLTGTASSGTGNSLANVITGNKVANQLNGGSGADTLNGGAGDDLLKGGEDGDTYIVTANDVITDEGTRGVDTASATGSYTLGWNSGVEVLSLAPSSTGNSALTGNDRNNKIVGNLGKNLLDGRGGDDALLGGGGDDTLIGDWGRDALTGGAGIDSFIFRISDSPTGQLDNITDFVSGTDKIDLELVPTKGMAADAYAATSIATDRFSDALAAANTAASGGGMRAVFVAGAAHGWLFWSSNSDRRTLEEGVRLDGLNSLSSFQRTDIV